MFSFYQGRCKKKQTIQDPKVVYLCYVSWFCCMQTFKYLYYISNEILFFLIEI